MHIFTTMHRHCGLHQLCVAPSQVCCSLVLHFVGGPSKRIGYFDWSRWLLSLELELRQLGISIGAESVPRTGYFVEPALGIGYLKVSVPETTLAGNRRLRVPDSLKEWTCGSDSQFGIG